MFTVSSTGTRFWSKLKYMLDAVSAQPLPEHLIVRSASDFAKLEESWGAAFATAVLPTQQFGWLKECAEVLASPDGLHLIVHRQADRMQAAAPLIHKPGSPGRLELLGAELGEPLDLLWTDQRALWNLARLLSTVKLPLVLNRIPADSPSIPAIRKAFLGKGIILIQERSGYPYIDLDPSWKAPEQKLNQRRRYDLRRALKRAEKTGPLRFTISTPKPEEVEPLLECACAVEARSWKGRLQTAMVHDPLIGRFFRRYSLHASRLGVLRICFLWIGDNPAAMQIAVQSSGRFCLLKIGYDEQFASCSPGHLLIRETIKYAAEQGIRLYDFLGVAEPWTRLWTSRERPCVSLRIYPASQEGIFLLGKHVAQLITSKLKTFLKRKQDGSNPPSGDLD